MTRTGSLGLTGNEEAIEEAKRLRSLYGIPTVACIVAGRQLMISAYTNEWDAIVMCYLLGTEGHGVADILFDNSPFQGTLPMTWYASVDRIEGKEMMFPTGYGIVEVNE